jgi:hypothetical protein
MSKFRCVCGYTIAISGGIPNPDEWLFISDAEFDEVRGTVDAEVLYKRFRRAFVCPASGHIWVFHDMTDPRPVGYAPINGPNRDPQAPPQ